VVDALAEADLAEERGGAVPRPAMRPGSATFSSAVKSGSS